MWPRRSAPSRTELDQAALELIARRGGEILATARRYAANADDAEDAYQRGLEILLTKAPSTREDELVPWLKTVVKHEAFAIRRQRDRHSPTTDDGDVAEPPTGPAATHDQAERYERLRQGAEALQLLKPQEIRALLLKAEGYSYQEICDITGWTYTKVNRCLTEGRRAFLRRMTGIEQGAECERLSPLLSALADGEATAADLAAVRPHLRSCLSCRARLREFRAAPARAAALLPPVALTGGGGALRGALESVAGAVQAKLGLVGERAGAAVELAAGQKVAAVAASAAAIAGGGAAVDRAAVDGGAERPAVTEAIRTTERPPQPSVQATTEPAGQVSQPPAAPEPAPRPSDTPPPPAAPPPPQQEFAPPEAGAAARAGAPAPVQRREFGP